MITLHVTVTHRHTHTKNVEMRIKLVIKNCFTTEMCLEEKCSNNLKRILLPLKAETWKITDRKYFTLISGECSLLQAYPFSKSLYS
jgi:hypothetical protein